MKKSYLYVFVVLLATNAIVGCNKTDMYFKHPFSIVNAKYRVAKIIGHLYFDNNYDTVVFHYDKWNKPSSIVRTTSGTGFENSYFYYDRKNRLSVIIQDAGGQPVLDSASRPLIFMNWRKYVYDQFGRIILDTNYIMGTTVIYDVETETFSPGPLNYNSFKYTKYTYDIFGRIVRAVQVWRGNLNPPGNPDPYPLLSSDSSICVSTYTYDANGNVINGSMYDNKINPHTTNWVWMFLDREYSLNNPFLADEYNSKDFPTRLSVGFSFVGFEYENVKIQYESVK